MQLPCLNKRSSTPHTCVVLFCQLGSDKAGEKQKEGLLTSDSHRPGCFSKKCFDMAYCSSRHQPANHAKLAAYMDEKPENAIKRKRLADKVAAYEEALEVVAAIHMHAMSNLHKS